MKINILEEKFMEVPNILAVKTYVKRFDKYETKKDCLNGRVLVDLSYFDDAMTENFKTLSLDFDVTLKDELVVNSVSLLDLDLCVIDRKGVSIKYNIEIDYTENCEDKIIEDEVIEIPLSEIKSVEEKENTNDDKKINNENLIVEVKDDNLSDSKTEEEIVSEQMSLEINQEYDKMLGETLQNREDNVVMTEVVSNDEGDFMDLFNMFEAHYLKVTKVLISDEDEAIKEFGLTREEFDKQFDKSSNVLTIKSYD